MYFKVRKKKWLLLSDFDGINEKKRIDVRKKIELWFCVSFILMEHPYPCQYLIPPPRSILLAGLVTFTLDTFFPSQEDKATLGELLLPSFLSLLPVPSDVGSGDAELPLADFFKFIISSASRYPHPIFHGLATSLKEEEEVQKMVSTMYAKLAENLRTNPVFEGKWDMLLPDPRQENGGSRRVIYEAVLAGFKVKINK